MPFLSGLGGVGLGAGGLEGGNPAPGFGLGREAAEPVPAPARNDAAVAADVLVRFELCCVPFFDGRKMNFANEKLKTHTHRRPLRARRAPQQKEKRAGSRQNQSETIYLRDFRRTARRCMVRTEDGATCACNDCLGLTGKPSSTSVWDQAIARGKRKLEPTTALEVADSSGGSSGGGGGGSSGGGAAVVDGKPFEAPSELVSTAAACDEPAIKSQRPATPLHDSTQPAVQPQSTSKRGAQAT
jgi:hypothetical protein